MGQEVVNMVPEQVTEMIATQVPRTQMREIIETIQPIVTQNVQYQTSVEYGGVTAAPQTYPAPMTTMPAPMTSYPMTTGYPTTGYPMTTGYPTTGYPMTTGYPGYGGYPTIM